MFNIQRGFVTRQLAWGGCQDLFRSFNLRSPCQAALRKVIASGVGPSLRPSRRSNSSVLAVSRLDDWLDYENESIEFQRIIGTFEPGLAQASFAISTGIACHCVGLRLAADAISTRYRFGRESSAIR